MCNAILTNCYYKQHTAAYNKMDSMKFLKILLTHHFAVLKDVISMQKIIMCAGLIDICNSYIKDIFFLVRPIVTKVGSHKWRRKSKSSTVRAH